MRGLVGVVCTALSMAVFAGACGDSDTEFGEQGGGDASGGAGAASNGGSGAATTNAGGSASGGSGGVAGNCDPPCDSFFECCNGECVNTANDILNCGECGEICDQDWPMCNNGSCGDAFDSCDQGTVCPTILNCCGTDCCEPDTQLCCVVEQGGPASPPACHDKVNDTCPKGTPGAVCAHPDTPIATPGGERPISSLGVGDIVFSVDDGAIVAVPIARIGRQEVRDHDVMRIRLDSGRTLFISAPHPTSDGTVGDLTPGATLEGPTVMEAELVPYGELHTYDILPASETGTYFAAGALLGSTLR